MRTDDLILLLAALVCALALLGCAAGGCVYGEWSTDDGVRVTGVALGISLDETDEGVGLCEVEQP